MGHRHTLEHQVDATMWFGLAPGRKPKASFALKYRLVHRDRYL